MADEGEGICLKLASGNGWEVISWVSSWWGIKGRGSGVLILVRPNVTLSRNLVQLVTVPIRRSSDVKHRPKKIICVVTLHPVIIRIFSSSENWLSWAYFLIPHNIIMISAFSGRIRDCILDWYLHFYILFTPSMLVQRGNKPSQWVAIFSSLCVN